MKAVLFVLALALVLISPAYAVTTRVPIEIKIPTKILEKMTPDQRAVVDDIVRLFEGRLFTFAELDTDLPTSAFPTDAGQIINLGSFFTVEQDNELERLAYPRRHLTPEQLGQVRQRALYKIESQERPGMYYVIALSGLLQKGQDKITITFQEHTASALGHIIIGVPESLWGNRRPSIRTGFRNLFHGVREIMGLFIGVTEDQPQYSAQEVDEKIEQEKAKYIEQALRDDKDELTQATADTGVDLRLYDPELRKKLIPVMERIISSCEDQKDLEKVFDAILKDQELNALSPRIGKLIVDTEKAREIVEAAELEFSKEVQEMSLTLQTELKAKHPIRGRIRRWVEKKHAQMLETYYESRVWDFYAALASKLERDGFKSSAAILRADVSYMRDKETAARASAAKLRLPRGVKSYDRLYWSRKSWRVKQNPENKKYYVEKSVEHQVDTALPAWRLRTAWQRFVSYLNNGLYRILVQNLWRGPIGLRALGREESFATDWRVDIDTGEIFQDTSRKTVWKKLADEWASVAEILDDHKHLTTYGPFGYRLERIGLYLTAVIPAAIIAPAILFLGQPLLTLANIPISAALALSSPIWAGLSSLGVWGFNSLIYDTEGTNYTDFGNHRGHRFARLLPVLNNALYYGIPAGLDLTGGTLALGYHSTMAVGQQAVGLTRTVLRQIWDFAAFEFIKHFMYVTGRDSRFFVKVQSGPGISTEYYFTVAPELILQSMWATMEQMELHRAHSQITTQIEQPRRTLGELMAGIAVVAGIENDGGRSLAYPEIAAAERRLKKELDSAFEKKDAVYRRLLAIPTLNIRLTDENLTKTRLRAAELAIKFYEPLLLAMKSNEDKAAFWASFGANEGNWTKVAEYILVRTFGEGILTSFRQTDQYIAKEVSDPSLIQYFRGLTTGELPEPLTETGFLVSTPVSTTSETNVSTDNTDHARRRLLSRMLGGFERPSRSIALGLCDASLTNKAQLDAQFKEAP